MPRRRNDRTGQFDTVYDEAAVLTILEGQRLTTAEIADELGCHRSTALERLHTLEAEDRIESTKAGQTLLWRITDSDA